MAGFINTIESLGDEEFVKRFIERTVTAYFDDSIENIGFAAFQSNSLLTEVNLPAVKSIASAAFRACSALKRVDLSACTSITGVATFGNSALETFILRTPSVCQCNATTPFLSTPIASGTGYIYVPAALVDSYKAAASWSTYADQIRAIEDYPEVCDPYSWVAVAKHIENGTYKDVYKIGDSVPVDMGSEGVINMQIAAFDADTLADGSGTAAISWVAKELLKTRHGMNTTATNADGWSVSDMRTYCNDSLYNMIPEEVQNIIREVSKLSDGGSSNKTLITTADKVWLPSHTEMCVSCSYTVSGQGVGYPLFETEANRAVVGSGSWYIRSTANYAANIWLALKADGSLPTSYNGANVALGVRLGFCTGRTPTT